MWIVLIVNRVVTFVTHRNIKTYYAMKQCLQYCLSVAKGFETTQFLSDT
jgi:uncharacterized membrane protein